MRTIEDFKYRMGTDNWVQLPMPFLEYIERLELRIFELEDKINILEKSHDFLVEDVSNLEKEVGNLKVRSRTSSGL